MHEKMEFSDFTAIPAHTTLLLRPVPLTANDAVPVGMRDCTHARSHHDMLHELS